MTQISKNLLKNSQFKVPTQDKLKEWFKKDMNNNHKNYPQQPKELRYTELY